MSKRILIITQAVDTQDQVLGFFVEWLREFARRAHTQVICLFQGVVPAGFKPELYSLEKEKGSSRLRRVLLFYVYLWKLRKSYDTVFVHMNPIYVIIGWPFFVLGKKKITLWYTHKHIDWKLRMATKLAHTVYSASLESFRLTTKKLIVTGHGIDVAEKFSFVPSQGRTGVVSISRISRTKQNATILRAYGALATSLEKHPLTIFGSPITADDHEYAREVHQSREELKSKGVEQIRLEGACTHDEVARVLGHAKVFVNLSNTGSLDKAVLEACARGCLVISSNEAFKDILGEWYCSSSQEAIVADLLKRACNLSDSEYEQIVLRNRAYVEKNHSLTRLIQSLVDSF